MKEQILSRLDRVKGNGTKFRAKCPVREHSSGNNTLSLLFNDDGRILIHCHAGCEVSDVLSAIGLSLSDLYPDGAIKDFMASAAPRKKEGKYDAWFEILEMQKARCKKEGTRLSEDTMKLAREMYKRKKNAG